jgi:alanyl-tRNA synthetase
VVSAPGPVTRRLHRDDPYLLEFDAQVVARREHQGRPAVVLDRTAFYAESGGQPWDTGTLDGVPVVAVVEQDGDVLHVLGGPLETRAVHGRVDADRRRDHMQQHHGQHLLSRAFVETASAATVSFHLGADVSTIDLDTAVSEQAVHRAERLCNEAVWSGRPVRSRVVSRREAEALGVHAADEAGDEVRLVEAEGFDLQACGGTHPGRTSEVGLVLVLGHERYKAGSRVRFVCGARAVAAFHARASAVDQVGALLSSPLDDLAASVARLQERLVEAARRGREMADRALRAEAARLLAAAGSPAVVSAVYEGWPADDLRALAQHLVGAGTCVALLASGAEKVHLVFAQSEGLPHDIPALLRQALAEMGGRGGGRGNLAQGGSDSAAGLEAALAGAERAVRERSAP